MERESCAAAALLAAAYRLLLSRDRIGKTEALRLARGNLLPVVVVEEAVGSGHAQDEPR